MTRVSLSRRRLLAGAAGAVGIAVLQRVALTQIEVPPDPTKVPGRPLTALGQRSPFERPRRLVGGVDRKSTRLNSSHSQISYAVFCLKKKKKTQNKYSE